MIDAGREEQRKASSDFTPPSRRAPARLTWLAALLPCLGCAWAVAENWPSWRGPRQDGVSAESSLPTEWSESKNVLWHTALPDRGNSTPVAWGDRVYVTQAIESEHRRVVMCLGAADGRLLWQSGVTYAEPEPTNGQNPYCSGSPATDGRRVVAYFGSAGLYCYDINGKEAWHRDVGKVDSWQGSGSSPVIVGDLCILNAGPGTEAALWACRMDTGEVAWKVLPPKVAGMPPRPRPDGPAARDAAKPSPPPKPSGTFDNAITQADVSGAGGYLGSWATPVLIHNGNRDELVVVHPRQMTAYNPATGEQLWTCGGLPEQAFATPAIGEGVLVALGHRMNGGGTVVTAVSLAGNAGDVTASRTLWRAEFPKECVGSGVIVGGHVFLVTQFGSIICLELRTGHKAWEQRLSGQGAVSGSWSSLVLADGKLLVPNQSGEVFVLAASPRHELLGVNWAGEEKTCASLAIADGRVFLRTYKQLWCFAKR